MSCGGATAFSLGTAPLGQGPLLSIATLCPSKNYGPQDAIRLFAFKGLQEQFRNFPKELDFTFAATGFLEPPEKRKKLADRLNPVISYILNPPALGSQAEIDGYRYIRCEAIKALAQVPLPDTTTQAKPRQETGVRPSRALPYEMHTSGRAQPGSSAMWICVCPQLAPASVGCVQHPVTLGLEHCPHDGLAVSIWGTTAVVGAYEHPTRFAPHMTPFQLHAESARSALADAEQIEGERRGAAQRAEREAIAAAVQREGEAEAAAILAKGQAEAEAREKNAEAFKLYGDAAILDILAGIAPDVVRAAAEPISAVERMTVIATDGASQLSKSVASNIEQGMQIGSDLTGIDLRSLFVRMAEKGSARLAKTGDGEADEE